MVDLEELAVRCEAATGPDEDLDAAICIAVGFAGPNADGAENIRLDDDWPGDILFEIGGEDYCNPIPAVTASVDAAMALAPLSADRWPQIEYVGPNPNNAEHGHRVRIWCKNRKPVRGKHPSSFALALCAAALRARLNPHEGDDDGR